ncbi:cytochrome P450 2J4-like [Lytechinus pictus]|uniref:cytochrome P450 2J4-like n=1 Tax=Lytechinus pictus TaxID=7653 RepID=UPI0030BA26DA
MLNVIMKKYGAASPKTVKSTIEFLLRLAGNRRHTTYVLALISLLLAMIFRGRSRRRGKLPPGPMGWPILGMLPYLDPDNPAQSVWDMSKQYGSVFCGRLGSHLAVFLNDYETIKEAFSRKDDAFSDRPRISMFEVYTKGHGIATCYYDNHWKEQRRFAVKAFRHFGVGKPDSVFEEFLMRESKHLLHAYSKKHVAFNLKPFIDMAACNIISSMTFGSRFSYSERTFQQFLAALDDIFHFADVAGVTNYLDFMKYVPFSGYSSFDQRVRELESGLFVKEREGHKRTYDSSKTRDLIDAFLHEIKKKRDEGAESDTTGFSDRMLLHFIADMFAAGTDTTSNSTQWLLLCAAKFEKEQRRVQEELDRVVGRDRLPTLSDRKNLPYTEAFLVEGMRFGVGGPFAVPHAAVRDTEFKGFFIPKGTVVVSNILSVLMDAKTFPEPEKFRPSRYLREDGTLRYDMIERVHSQFGIGRRTCIGDQMARAERYVFLTHLLHTYNMSGSSGPDSLSLKSHGGLTRNPVPFDVILTERSPMITTSKICHGL